MGFFVFIVVAFILMWLLVVLPQRRRQAAQRGLIESLEPGQEILTAGGMYGDVTEVGEDEVAIEIAPGVVVRVAMRAIAAVIPPDVYEDDEDDEGDEAGEEGEDGEDGEDEADAADPEVPTEQERGYPSTR